MLVQLWTVAVRVSLLILLFIVNADLTVLLNPVPSAAFESQH